MERRTGPLHVVAHHEGFTTRHPDQLDERIERQLPIAVRRQLSRFHRQPLGDRREQCGEPTDDNRTERSEHTNREPGGPFVEGRAPAGEAVGLLGFERHPPGRGLRAVRQGCRQVGLSDPWDTRQHDEASIGGAPRRLDTRQASTRPTSGAVAGSRPVTSSSVAATANTSDGCSNPRSNRRAYDSTGGSRRRPRIKAVAESTSAMRGGHCSHSRKATTTASPKQSPSSCTTSPVATPTRSGSSSATAACCSAAALRIRWSADGSSANTPSPVLLTIRPPNTPTTARTTASWRWRSPSAASTPSPASTDVDPMMSVTSTFSVAIATIGRRPYPSPCSSNHRRRQWRSRARAINHPPVNVSITLRNTRRGTSVGRPGVTSSPSSTRATSSSAKVVTSAPGW